MTYDDIAQNLMVAIPGVIKATVRKAVIAAARKLCIEANVIAVTETLTLPAGADSISLSVTDATLEPVRVIYIEDLRRNYYAQVSESMLKFLNTQVVDIDYVVTMACRPADGASDLHPDLLRWDEAIENYALYRMMIMPGKEWSNPQLAQHHFNIWSGELSTAKQSMALGFNSGPARIKSRNFV
ncbi:hypothetical protein [uncultured Amphritea sp.]|uniref:hypothetical protein n=1 Tax=uncultured Amphritea sp. TaxID=981605 RepID=UPI00260B1F93|nr:hypothetical protein [uncultured Amphritea sp.]